MLLFNITAGGKLGNLERPELKPVCGNTILSKAYYLVVQYQYPATGSGVVPVPLHDWADRVLNPSINQAIGEV
jgi:hypothetical protein